MWVHWVQAGMDPDAWRELFVGHKRCLLKRAEADRLYRELDTPGCSGCHTQPA
jgi:hypothetical protein